MKAFLAAQAFVQIIGIAVLRNHESGVGVQVILPRVEAATTNAQTVPHTAILVFKKTDLIQKFPPWRRAKRLKPVPGYSYLELNGDRIRLLIAKGSNQPAAIPPQLPHLTDCPFMETLRPGYRPPDYESAAAVVSIPWGTLEACRAIAPNVQGRIDTRITLNIQKGSYSVMVGGTFLTLKADSVLLVVNAPTAWVEGPQGTTFKHVSHANAYFSMATEQSAPCSLSNPGPVMSCDVAFLALPNAHAVPHFPQLPMPFKTYECSNTQWP